MKKRHILRLGALLLLACLLTGCFPFGSCFFDEPDRGNSYGTQSTETSAPTGEAALGALQADQIHFLINTEYETRFTVRAENVSQVELVYEGQTVCSMVDDGSDRDELAGDGIFTCTVTNSGDSAEAGQLYAVSGSLRSEPVTLYYFGTPTEEDLTLFEGAQLTVQSYFAAAADENGCVAPEDVPDLLAQTEFFISNLCQRGEVLHYEVYDTHVRAKFACGITAVYMPKVAGLDAGSGDGSIYTFQPFYENYSDAIDPYLDNPDKAAQCIAQTFDNYDWEGNNDERAVTLDSIRNFGENEVILWHGHGGYDEALGPFLVTGERYDRDRMMEQSYFEDVIHDRIFSIMDNRMAFTPAYVALRCGSLEGSFLYLGSCESGRDSRLADVFLRKGATAVVANSATISSIYNLRMQHQVVEYMTRVNTATGDYCTLAEALSLAMGDLGSDDRAYRYAWDEFAHPIIFGGTAAEDYRFGHTGSTPRPSTEPTATVAEPITEPTEPAVTGSPYADYLAFLDSYLWVDYVASDLSEIPPAEYDDFWMGSYSIYDVNKDGIDELIILCGQSIADTSYNFYSWKEGQIYVIGAIFAGSGLYGPRNGSAGILVRNAGGDIETLTHLEMTWEGLHIVSEKDYYYQREDYVDPKTDWVWLEQYSVHDMAILEKLAG